MHNETQSDPMEPQFYFFIVMKTAMICLKLNQNRLFSITLYDNNNNNKSHSIRHDYDGKKKCTQNFILCLCRLKC